jgi:pimeloyl-ACP methyl ester carboxylesterase
MKKIIASAYLLMALSTCGMAGEDFFFDSAGVRIHYIVEGQGEPVVLLHGFAFDLAANWAQSGIIKGLADRFQVIAVDNRGHGRSDKPHDPQNYGVNMVSDVVRLLDHMRIRRAHIVGYSMGGRIASVFLTTYPERVQSVVLGATPWVRPDSLATRVAWANALAESLEQGRGVGPLVARVTPRDEQPPSAERIETLNRMILQHNDARALAAVMRGTANLEPEEAKLRANHLPALAIVGERDPVKDEMENLVAVLGSVKLVVIPGANHLDAFGRPEFLSAIKEFLIMHAER